MSHSLKLKGDESYFKNRKPRHDDKLPAAFATLLVISCLLV